jgi:hypothetical protein
VVKTIPLSVRVEAGMPWSFEGFGERVDDNLAGDAAVGGDREGVAGVVVDPAEDLDVAAVSEAVVGEVGLPALIGQVGLEADVGRLRALGRLDLGEAVSAQGAVDRRPRDAEVVVLSEMPGDRVGTGVEALSDQFVTELHDQLDDRGRGGSWARVRSSRPRLKRRVALGAVAGEELGHPSFRHVIFAGDVDGAAAFDDNGSDDKTGQ